MAADVSNSAVAGVVLSVVGGVIVGVVRTVVIIVIVVGGVVVTGEDVTPGRRIVGGITTEYVCTAATVH